MKRFTALLLLSACAADGANGAPRDLPADVLCQIWKGTGPVEAPGMIQGWGTNADDVRGILGEPTERDGNVWTYEFTRGSLTVTFEAADLCTGDGTKVQPALFVSDLDAEGFDARRCWVLDQRNREPTCDGCIEPWSVGKCR